MNALLQIIIVCPDQRIAEIPGVFTERIVIDAETKGFHIVNHKNGGGTGISLAEGMNLPNIRCKLCKELYRCFNRQSLIAHLRILLIRRNAGFHPCVNFADFEFPQPADFGSRHFSALDPVKNGVTAYAQIFHNLFHRIPAFKVVIHSETIRCCIP